MKVSIRRISQETGFSPATVSNALNHKKGVNRYTAERIFQTAEKLGYQQDKPAAKIRFVTFRKNGLIIDDSSFFPSVIEGVEHQAKELGYETVYSHLNYEDELFEVRLKEVLEDKASLVILLGTEMTEEDFGMFREFKGKIILLDGWSDTVPFSGILINNTDASSKAVEYLVRRGHKKIGYIRGAFRIKAFQYREYGYQRVLDRYGIYRNPDFIVTTGTQLESAYEGMKKYLKTAGELPTAFFADNDIIALGAMRALREAGYRIPEDVSIIGFDDISFGAISKPELTTIHVFKQEMGELAVRRILDNINYKGTKAQTKIQVCTAFVERESVRDLRNGGE